MLSTKIVDKFLQNENNWKVKSWNAERLGKNRLRSTTTAQNGEAGDQSTPAVCTTTGTHENRHRITQNFKIESIYMEKL